MKKHFFMDCRAVMDAFDLAEKDELLPFLTRVRLELHFLVCPQCVKELKKLRCVEEIMKTDFIPHCPDFEKSVMECLYEEADPEEKIDAPAGFSFRGWVLLVFLCFSPFRVLFLGLVLV